MVEKIRPEDVTDDVRSAVDACLVAKAAAETLRKQVDTVAKALLAETPMHGDRGQITDPDRLYLCEDEALVTEYYAELDVRLRAAGIKPEDMERDYCPALVAEEIYRKATRMLIGAMADMMKYEGGGEELHHALICAGLDKYHDFVDLSIKAVVAMPGFVAPKIG